MKALLWFFGIIVGLSLLLRVLAPVIARALLRRLNRYAEEDMKRQSRVYRETVENNSPFEDNYFVDDDTKVTVPKKHDKKRPPRHKQESSEVDYEDVD